MMLTSLACHVAFARLLTLERGGREYAFLWGQGQRGIQKGAGLDEPSQRSVESQQLSVGEQLGATSLQQPWSSQHSPSSAQRG